MKRGLLFGLLLLLLACAWPTLGRDSTPTAAPHGFCGDGVCNGPENHRLCPQDCGPGERPERTPQATAAAPQATAPQAQAGQGEVAFADIVAFVTLDRDPGRGTCGQAPWRSEDCTKGADWWGLHYKAATVNLVLVIPDGPNRWVLTNHPDVVQAYGFEASLFESTGYYQAAEITSYAGHEECHAQTEGNSFRTLALATYENGQITVTYSFSQPPQEHTWGACATANFDWHLSNVLYGWGVALSGSPTDLTATLTQADRRQEGIYEHIFRADTNPSPENRDHVQVVVQVLCMTPDDEALTTLSGTACPWEK